MKVLSLGLPRSGSRSMAEALTILGYKDVHHALNCLNDVAFWNKCSRAVDASFPSLPSYTGSPFTRSQWDDMFGPSEAVTDIGSLFSPQLIEAYPDAKVILTIRDIDSWCKSFCQMCDEIWSGKNRLLSLFVEPLIGFRLIETVQKLILGFFDSASYSEVRRNSRSVYARHHRQLQAMVPPEKLLVYRLGQGWEPICSFLGKQVPDVPFPHMNETKAFTALISARQKIHVANGFWKLIGSTTDFKGLASPFSLLVAALILIFSYLYFLPSGF